MFRFSILVCVLFLVRTYFSQFCATPTTNITITPTATTQQSPIYTTGIRAFNFAATAGCTYTFSTCGLSTLDTKFRLYDATNTQIGVADNGCANGIQAEMIWSCSASGNYTLLLTKYNCIALTASTRISYSVNCAQPCTSPPVVNAGSDFSICSGSTAQLNASVSPGNTSGGANLTVTINGQNQLDETTWTLTNASGTVGSGGPYFATSTASQSFPLTTSGPLSFYIETQGINNNNVVSYSISCNGSVINSGNINGGQTSTISVTNCNVGSNTAPISYSWSPTLPLNAANILNPVATISTNTTFTLTATQGSCVVNDQITVSVAQTPIVSIGASPSTEVTCVTPVTLTGNGAVSYMWYLNNVLVGSSATLIVNTPGTYLLVGSNGINCQSTQSIVLTGNTQPPTAGITNNTGTNQLTCTQTSISLSATGTGSYSWSNGSSNVGSGANLSVSTPGTYTVTLTGSNGCTATSSIVITQDIQAPTAGITNNTGTNQLTCAQTSISLSATGTGSYSWSNGSSNVGSGANLSVSTPGTYTVTLTGSNGCTATSSIVITQDTQAPTAGITNNTGTNQLTCAQTSISLSATGTGSYSWSNGSSNVGSGANLSVSTPGTYTVTLTGSNGCTATSSIVITQDTQAPTAGITNNTGTNQLTCTQTSISLSATGTGSYSWSNGSSNVGSGANLSVSTPGTYTVTLTGSNGCTATSSIVITQDIQAPTAGITNNTGTNQLTCAQTSISLSATGTGSYSWSNGSSNVGSGANLSVSTPGTYTVTLTGSNGCTATSSIVITQDTQAPTAGITNNTGTNQLTCAQTSISLSATGTGSYSWSNGSSNVGSGANLSVSTPGTYTVTLTGSNGCTATSSIVITQDTQAPTAGITNNTGTNQLTCTQTSISLSATGTGSYSWSNGSSNVGSGANLSVSTPGTYTVTLTGSNGCTATSSIVITQDIQAPTAGITNNTGTNQLTCAQTSISLSATGTGSYSWSNGSSNVGSGANLSVSTPGTYTVTLTGQNGCVSSANIIISQDVTIPTVSINTNSTANILTCTTTIINLTAIGGATYSWLNGNTIVGGNASYNVTSPGTYTVNVTGSNGCTATSSIVITQDIQAPTAGITNNTGTNQLTCTQTSISLNATGGVNYAWSNGVNIIGNNANVLINSPGTYTASAIGANGCIDTEIINISQNITPPVATIINATGTSVLDCNTTNITLNANGGVSYSWSSGLINLGNNSSLTVSNAGVYILTTLGANGCIDTDSITVTFSANTTPIFSTLTSICTGAVINLPNTSTNGILGSWSPLPNNLVTTTYTFTPNTGICANPVLMTVNVNPYPNISAINDTICLGNNATINTQIDLPGGTYTWIGSSNTQSSLITTPGLNTSYTVVYNLAGCTDTASAQVIVKPVPVVQVQSVSICAGQTGSLVATADLPNGSFLWSNNTTNDSLILSPITNTTEYVSYTVNGCTSLSVAGTITVNPVPSITMNNQTICFGDYVTMQANAVPAGIFYWGPNAVQGNSSNTFLPVQDTVIQVYNSLNGCNSDTITAQISVTPLPNSSFTASVLQGCVPLSVTLTAANSSNNSYTWQTSNQLTATSSQANFNFITNGVYDVSLTTTSNGCSSTTTITNMIAVDNYPIASFEPSVLTFTEPQQQLTFTNYSIGASSYVWDFGDASIDYSESPIHLFSQTDSGYVVLLTAISSLGCSDTASIRIDFDPGLVYYIPNSFTPDGDQFNQVFRPIFSSGIDPFNYKLHIYNRWEDLIFESNDPETGWDGTYEAGQACQSGAYTYEIFIKIPDTDEKRMIIGHVNLIR